MPEPEDKAPEEENKTPEVVAHEAEGQELPWCADNQCVGNSVE